MNAMLLRTMLFRTLSLVQPSWPDEGTNDEGKRTNDEGMSTAEYAIGTIAAAAFAAVLYTVVTGDSVLNTLTALIQRAISVDL